MKQIQIGIQMYSLSQQFEDDPRGTLRALAGMGYEGVEFAWQFGGLPPDELKRLLDELNLRTVGIYAKTQQLADESDLLWGYAEALGCRYLTTGMEPKANEDDWPEAIREVGALAGQAAKRGFRLLYHNHWQELHPMGQTTALDALFEALPAERLGAELDVAYFIKAGLDPVAYVRRYGERTPLLHARDIAADGASVPVGQGEVDFPGIIAAARDAATEWLVVEQNPSPEALRDAATSIEVLRGGLEPRP